LRDRAEGSRAKDDRREQGMPIGTVKWFNATKGYGFIKPDEGTKDAFVHISAVQRAGLQGLSEGQKIEFELVEDRRGRMAADNLRLID
jgi:CspA family cold shock protein